MSPLRLEDLPPNLRAQIEAKAKEQGIPAAKGRVRKTAAGVPNHTCRTCGEPYRSDAKASEHTAKFGHTRWVMDMTLIEGSES